MRSWVKLAVAGLVAVVAAVRVEPVAGQPPAPGVTPAPVITPAEADAFVSLVRAHPELHPMLERQAVVEGRADWFAGASVSEARAKMIAAKVREHVFGERRARAPKEPEIDIGQMDVGAIQEQIVKAMEQQLEMLGQMGVKSEDIAKAKQEFQEQKAKLKNVPLPAAKPAEKAPAAQIVFPSPEQIEERGRLLGIALHLDIETNISVEAGAALDLLRSPVDAERERGVRELNDLELKPTEFGPIMRHLLPGLADKSLNVRERVAEVIGDAGEAGSPAVTPLIDLMKGVKPLRVRSQLPKASTHSLKDAQKHGPAEAASKALGRIGAPSVEPLRTLLKAEAGPDAERNREWAAITLGRVGAKAAPAVPDLFDILNKDGPAPVRAEAVQAIRAIGTSDAAIIRKLEASLDDADQDIRLAAIVAMGSLGTNTPESAVAKVLDIALKEGNPILKMQAAQSLGAMGKAAASAIAARFAVLNDEQKLLLLQPLSSLIERAPETHEILRPLVQEIAQSPKPELAFAGRALRMHIDQRAVEKQVQPAPGGPMPPHVAQIADRVRALDVKPLREGKDNADADALGDEIQALPRGDRLHLVPLARELLHHPNLNDHRKGVFLSAMLGTASESLIPDLTDVLRKEADVTVLEVAVTALMQQSEKAKVALPLIQQLEQKYPNRPFFGTAARIIDGQLPAAADNDEDNDEE